MPKIKIETLDTNVYSTPDKDNRIAVIGKLSPEDVFDKLHNFLSEIEMIPEEYIEFNDSFYSRSYPTYDVRQLPKEMLQFSTKTDWGGSEGIYVDIYVDMPNNQKISFATGKTLGETGNDFLKMSKIEAMCNLFLNGGGQTVELNLTNEKINQYYLSSSPNTPYVILETNKNDALLRRFISSELTDPTPYIYAHNVNIKDDNIEWDNGVYLSSFKEAAEYLSSKTELNIESDNIKLEGFKGTWYVIDEKEYNGENLYLLESEQSGDEIPNVIVDKFANVKIDSAYNGFLDYEEAMESDNIEKCYEDVTGEALSKVIDQLDLENRSLAFSVVKISSKNNSIEAFTSRLVGRDDLESSDIYHEFIESEDDGTINISIQSYCIGNGETVHADDDEAKLIEEYYEDLKAEFGIDYLDSELISINFEAEQEY